MVQKVSCHVPAAARIRLANAENRWRRVLGLMLEAGLGDPVFGIALSGAITIARHHTLKWLRVSRVVHQLGPVASAREPRYYADRMQEHSAVVEKLHGKRVLVVGDVMLDEYLRGDVARVSPDSPVPVLEVKSQELRLGGAGNTAANVVALGGTAMLVGLIGRDEAARHVTAQTTKLRIAAMLSGDATRPTTKKTRLLAQGQAIVRLDQEKRHSADAGACTAMRDSIDKAFAAIGVDVVVISDYNKGTITAEIAQYVIAAARGKGVPIVVDSKRRDLAIFRGATLLMLELGALDRAVPAGLSDYTVAEVAAAAVALAIVTDGAALVVRRGSDGWSLFASGATPVHGNATTKEVFEGTGACDTQVATLALALAAGSELSAALHVAQRAAVVSTRGAVTVTAAALLAALSAESAAP